MSDQNKNSVFDTVDEALNPPKGSSMRKLKTAISVGVVALSLLAALPTVWTIYQAVTKKVPPSQVSYRIEQQKIWEGNADCVPKIDFQALNTGDGVWVDVGACPTSGDILFRVAAPEVKPRYQWIAIANLKDQKPDTFLDWIVSSANAAPAKRRGVRMAQARSQGIKIQCQTVQPKAQLVRIVNEGGQCFRESMSMFDGQVQKREAVPCNTQCPAKKTG